MPVIMVIGSGRSGSTLLERVVALEHPEIVAVGELWHIWTRGYQRNELCACGTPFSACAFWGPVVARVQEGFGSLEAFEAAIEAFGRVVQRRVRPRSVLKSRPGDLQPALQLAGSLYEVLREQTQASVIIDTSKNFEYAYLVGALENVRLGFVHLVRDVRAVVYSWQREKVRPEVFWEHASMDRYPAWRVALDWTHRYLSAVALCRGTRPSVTVRYESFVRDPKSGVDLVQALAERLGSRDQSTAPNGATTGYHSVAGNPMRLAREIGPIQPDDEWRTKLSRRDRAIATMLASPLLALHLRAIRNHGSA